MNKAQSAIYSIVDRPSAAPPPSAPAAARAFVAQAGAALQACRFAGDGQAGAPRVWATVWQAPAPAGARPETARTHARATARGALARLLADALGLRAGAIALDNQRGRPPRALAADRAHRADPALAPRLAALGLSISHASAGSLIAWRQGGPVGVDLQALPDWPRTELLRLARDYLGNAVAQSLATQAEGAPLRRAFAAAWAAHEAQLKCLGEPLAEWSAGLAARLAGGVVVPLSLAMGEENAAAAVAWR